MTYDEIIAVIEAYKKGRTIQYFSKNTNKWYDCEEEPSWDFHSTQFRVKPSEEPTPQKGIITFFCKEWLQEIADSCAFSASAYEALRRDDLLNYFNGQRDAYLFLLEEMFGVRYDERVFPINEDTKKKIIDSIFDNYKPYGKKTNP